MITQEQPPGPVALAQGVCWQCSVALEPVNLPIGPDHGAWRQCPACGSAFAEVDSDPVMELVPLDPEWRGRFATFASMLLDENYRLVAWGGDGHDTFRVPDTARYWLSRWHKS